MIRKTSSRSERKSPIPKKSFDEDVKKYLHPEAVLFYREVFKAVESLSQLQKDINDPENKFQSGLGGYSYPLYAFDNNINYKTWIEDTNKIYQNVKNYDDLIRTNLMFLEGLMPMTFYHSGPIYDTDLIKTKEITSKYRFFTMDGQSNFCDNYLKQRTYLSGIIPLVNLKSLRKKLDNSDFWYSIYIISERKYYTNIPYESLTKQEWKQYRFPEGTPESDDEDEYYYNYADEVLYEFFNLTIDGKIPFTNLWKDDSKQYWKLIKNNPNLNEEVKKEINDTCAVIEIVGHEYCKGSIQDYLAQV
jgi:hypothetical protein